MSIIHFIDIETTGFSYKKIDRIVEFAILKYDTKNNLSLENINEIINPERLIPYKVSQIHGIYDKDVIDKPKMKDKIDHFLNIFQHNHYIAGHNISNFDIPFILQEIIRCDVEVPKNFILLDTLKISKKYLPDLKSHSLDALCDYFKIDKSKRTLHGALIDCELTKDVFIKLNENFNLSEDIIKVDENYILNKNLNYTVEKSISNTPKYLNLNNEEEQYILAKIRSEKACLPWINYKNNEVLNYIANDSNYIPLISIISKYKFVSQQMFAFFLRHINVLNEDFYPTKFGLENNFVKYKIKNNGNREIIFLVFNFELIKEKLDKDTLKNLKEATVKYYKECE